MKLIVLLVILSNAMFEVCFASADLHEQRVAVSDCRDFHSQASGEDHPHDAACFHCTHVNLYIDQAVEPIEASIPCQDYILTGDSSFNSPFLRGLRRPPKFLVSIRA